MRSVGRRRNADVEMMDYGRGGGGREWQGEGMKMEMKLK
jgi:hypothetical protein